MSGISGASGVIGGTGGTGASGDSGVSGLSGESGISGVSGIAGISGVSGISGISGVSGIAGVSGASGQSGAAGGSGGTGNQGLSGVSGVSGIAGISGVSGLAGVSGASGISGVSGVSGIAGPNTVTTATTTNIVGLLKGNGSTVSAAVAGMDYVSPAGPFGLPVSSFVTTAQNYGSTTYGALGTAQAVTVTVSAGGTALVSLATQMEHNNSSGGCAMSFTVSGTGGIGTADDDRSVMLQGTTGVLSPGTRIGGTWLITGLTGGGSRTFTAQFRSVNDPTNCTFSDRSLVVIPY